MRRRYKLIRHHHWVRLRASPRRPYVIARTLIGITSCISVAALVAFVAFVVLDI